MDQENRWLRLFQGPFHIFMNIRISLVLYRFMYTVGYFIKDENWKLKMRSLILYADSIYKQMLQNVFLPKNSPFPMLLDPQLYPSPIITPIMKVLKTMPMWVFRKAQRSGK